MTPECSKHIKKLHALLMQVRAEVQAIQPLLEEELDTRSAIAEALNKRLDEGHGCPATTAADQAASVDADVWACDAEEALDSLGALSTVAGDMGTLLKQAALADWMLANRSSVYAKSSGPSAPLVIPATDDNSSGESGERQKIVALCSEAEQILSQSHSTPTQWMGLLANVHSLCHTYADCVAPHGRFHFRQLIAKLETQTKEMKQTSVIGPLRNSSEHSRLVGDVKNTVRDLANALQR